jgi:hypothetical protein
MFQLVTSIRVEEIGKDVIVPDESLSNTLAINYLVTVQVQLFDGAITIMFCKEAAVKGNI